MTKRTYITYEELLLIISSLESERDEIRNKCMIFMAFIHGLRASELTGLMLSDIDLTSDYIYIRRLKNGRSVQHPLFEQEKPFLKQWMSIRANYQSSDSPWLFLSHKGGRLSRQRIYSLIRELGDKTLLPIHIHPHMLRHACGYGLANQGIDTRLIQDYLGHKNIRHTVLYTISNANRFSYLWTDISKPIIK